MAANGKESTPDYDHPAVCLPTTVSDAPLQNANQPIKFHAFLVQNYNPTITVPQTQVMLGKLFLWLNNKIPISSTARVNAPKYNELGLRGVTRESDAMINQFLISLKEVVPEMVEGPEDLVRFMNCFGKFAREDEEIRPKLDKVLEAGRRMREWRLKNENSKMGRCAIM